ncbi:hypothetical protein [Jatrophihabitans sp.]|uniref:hypothetical protein n=1 Tax=Jatrophihabitans sp. TaxID=1932789 RepID=UPI0030C68DD4
MDARLCRCLVQVGLRLLQLGAGVAGDPARDVAAFSGGVGRLVGRLTAAAQQVFLLQQREGTVGVLRQEQRLTGRWPRPA